MMNFKISYILLTVTVLSIAMVSCNEKGPGYDYFPDMRDSRAYESYAMNNNFDDSMAARKPAAGSIPRGYEPFHYENTIEDYERAGAELKNPYAATPENIETGKYYYDIYCAICHGPGGEGDGNIVKREKFPPPPSYFTQTLMELPEGKMFFSTHYGKGLMGSYASQVSKEERWKIITYIKDLQRQKTAAEAGSTATTANSTSATNTATDATTTDTTQTGS